MASWMLGCGMKQELKRNINHAEADNATEAKPSESVQDKGCHSARKEVLCVRFVPGKRFQELCGKFNILRCENLSPVVLGVIVGLCNNSTAVMAVQSTLHCLYSAQGYLRLKQSNDQQENLRFQTSGSPSAKVQLKSCRPTGRNRSPGVRKVEK
jgi:hypothetical protein